MAGISELGGERGPSLESPNFRHLTGQSSPEELGAYALHISHLFAVDGMPVPPSSKLIREAHSLGIGPGGHIVQEVSGSIRAFEESAGFIMPGTCSNWTREDFIENGRWISHTVGTAEHPIMPRVPNIMHFSKNFLGPSIIKIVEQFGAISAYQDALGFVNKATLERWSDDEWVANGIWLSHMLGSPEEPVMPTQKTIDASAMLKICPPWDQIVKKFGTIQNYQRAIGFKPRETTLDYPEWERKTFVENGQWLSHAIGTPEAPVMPTSSLIDEAAALDLCPPGTALRKRFRSLLIYQDALGFVSQATLDRWKDRDWIANGIWLSHMLGSPEEPVMPRRSDFDAGSAAHITPNVDEIREHFGVSLIEFQAMLGFANRNRFRLWGIRQYIRHGLELQIGQNPVTQTQFNAAEGPTHQSYSKKFGSIAKFNERLGLTDFKSWNEADFVNLGVQYMIDHEGQTPTPKDIRRRWGEGRSPHYSAVFRALGPVDNQAETFEKAYQEFCNLSELLRSELGAGNNLIRLVTQDFKTGEDYAREAYIRVQKLKDLTSKGTSILPLITMFEKSRLTVRWDNDDFLYFGKHFFGKKTTTIERAEVALRTLEQYGITPYLDEIEEVFGSIQEFLKQSRDQVWG